MACNCDGANDKLCFAKLHAMAEASIDYTLGAFDLAQNVKHDYHDARANGTRRISDSDITTLGKRTSSSGVKTLAALMKSTSEV